MKHSNSSNSSKNRMSGEAMYYEYPRVNFYPESDLKKLRTNCKDCDVYAPLVLQQTFFPFRRGYISMYLETIVVVTLHVRIGIARAAFIHAMPVPNRTTTQLFLRG